MNAMTWWDHKTESIWSQVWGRAIDGPLKGTELELLPSQLVPWETWRVEHPNTLALDPGEWRLGRQRSFDGYIIGVPLGESAMVFPYHLAAAAGIINDAVGPYPVVVHVEPETKSVHVYLRQKDGQTLTFVQEGGTVQDRETGSTWEMSTGLAVGGALEGRALRSVPYIPAYRSAWQDFYPQSLWYDGS
jgi:hypothetical protein